MTDPTTSTPARFVANTETLEDVLKTQTIGLVHLSEFKKRRIELEEQRDREAVEKLQPIRSGGGGGGPASSSREGSEAPPAGAVRELRSARRRAKGNYHSLGGVMVMMARMMPVTLHPPTRQGLIVRITIRVPRRTR